MNDKNKADTHANFFSSVFTIKTPGSWEVVDYQENQISDDLFISKETILNELNALETLRNQWGQITYTLGYCENPDTKWLKS